MDAGALDIIDAKSLEKVKSIPTKRGLHDMAVTGDGKFAAAGSPGGKFITVFDLQKMEIAWEVQYDQGILPLSIENNPDGSGRRIFAQLNQTNGFSVVDFATHKEVTRIKFPDEPKGFAPGCEGISHGIGIAPDNKTLWANSRPANAVFAYSLPDLKLLGHVSLPETNVGKSSGRGTGLGHFHSRQQDRLCLHLRDQDGLCHRYGDHENGDDHSRRGAARPDQYVGAALDL